MDLSSNNFAHEPLNYPNSEIRILSLLPGSFDDEIECLVALADLNKQPKPEYDALSYVWGDDKITKPIYLANHSSLDRSTLGRRERSPVPNSRRGEKALCFKQFPVTTNLEAALRQLRFQNKTRDMWIDAICIDQKVPGEVKPQVQRMGQIYAMASQVSVWLGRMCEDRDLLDGFNAGDVQSGFQYLHDLKRRMIASDFNWSRAIHDNTSLPSNEILRALEALCRRPWFARVWVQQEHILAKSPVVIHCGPEKMNFRDFGTTIRLVVRQFLFHGLEVSPSLYGAMRIYGFEKIFQRQHFVRKAPGEKLLITLMNMSGFFCATKPQDKVFGILGLVHMGEKAPYVTPNYEKPLDEFYLELTRDLIVDTLSLAALQGVGRASETLPSWVSEWNVVCGPSFKHHEKFRKHTFFDFSVDNRILHTKAIALGKVVFSYSNVRNTADGSEDYQKILGNIERRLQDIPRALDRYSNTTNARLALEETLSAWCVKSHNQAYYVEKPKIFTSRAMLNVSRGYDEEDFLKGTVVFVLSSGAVGSLLGDRGFGDVAEGDSVYLFPGCTSPHILRRRNQEYRILCRCTVDGFQDLTDEAHLTALENGPWEDVSIV